MAAMLDSGAHSNDQPVEIHTDAVAPVDVTGVTMRVPVEFQNILVISYRPNHVWVDVIALSPEISF